MKKWVSVVLCIVVVATFGLFALGSGETTETDQGSGAASNGDALNNSYTLKITSSRLAKTYDKQSAIIVKYAFTNNSDEPTSFMLAFDDNAYQNGIGLNETVIMPDSANYSYANQTKEVKKGATLDVEVAYVLNDTTTDVVVEVEELFSFNDSKVKKTFRLK